MATIFPLLQPLQHPYTLFLGPSRIKASRGAINHLTSGKTIDFLNGAVALKALTLPRQMKESGQTSSSLKWRLLLSRRVCASRSDERGVSSSFAAERQLGDEADFPLPAANHRAARRRRIG